MARPTLTDIDQLEAWDAAINDNNTKISEQPFPIHESASLTEANVTATFPPSAYDRCLVWVNHTVIGYTLYESDGTRWRPYQPKKPIRSDSGSITLNPQDVFGVYTGTGGHTWTLALANTWSGREIIIKNNGSGALTVDGNGAETIDGAANISIPAGEVRKLISTGTAVLISTF